jgi:hypothetical protein
MIKRQISFDSLISLMKKGHAVILCGEGTEPSVELILEDDEYPEDLDDVIKLIERDWDDL